MQATLPLQPATTISEPPPPSYRESEASLEIHAYLASRNLLLREAEENTTEANLRRAATANDFAEQCLHPARSPYQTQALPEVEAARERRHCNAVKLRIAELRARAGQRRRARLTC